MVTDLIATFEILQDHYMAETKYFLQIYQGVNNFFQFIFELCLNLTSLILLLFFFCFVSVQAKTNTYIKTVLIGTYFLTNFARGPIFLARDV